MGRVMKVIAGLFALISGQTEWVDPIYDDKATFPQKLTNMQQMLRTMPYFPEARPLEFRGRIPKWVSGTFYRNGPGIYEYGEDKYNHLFDPTAILQGLHIKDGKMTYNSNVVKSWNYQDPYTMETLGQLSLAQAKNFPEKMFCVTN